MVLTDVESRKARRKEERRAKKKSKRSRDKNLIQHDDAPAPEPRVKKAKTQKKKQNPAKSSRAGDSNEPKSKEDDPYADLDPAIAAAMRNDDAEIEELESKLNLSKEKDRLYREYAKLEGYGNDFGDFLDDLDNLTNRVSGKQPHTANGEYEEAGFSEEDNDYYASSDGEEIVPMKDHSTEDLEEDYSMVDNMEEEDGSDKSGDDETKPDNSDSDTGSETGSNSDASDDGDREMLQDVDHDLEDTYRPSEGEDIYGKTKGHAISGQPPTKYVPPHLRKKQQENDTDRINALRSLERSLNNVLNRLSEDTMISVSQSIAKLYPSNPTSDVNDCLWKNLRNACVAKPFVMSGFIPVYVSCMVGVHFQTGDQVQLGGYLLEQLITQLWKELSAARIGREDDSNAAEDEFISKEASNLTLVLCYLYNYGIVHCTFLYDVIRELIEHFSELDVEVLLLLLSHSGYSLRSDDPLALKEIVLLVQDRAVQAQTNDDNTAVASSTRVQYMIAAMTDIKNNKKSKQDKALGEKTAKLRKLLGRVKSTVTANGVIRMSDSSLRITLTDVLNVETNGRWWKVGASWSGNQMHRSDDEDSSDNERRSSFRGSSPAVPDSDDKLLQLASKLRMNTDVRRSIFCIIMGSEDCDDSFEKLVRAGMLKNRTERDTVRVLMECCGNEKSYNPFYSHLAYRICDYQPQCKFTFQLAFWDTFKQFEAISMRKAANLAKLLFQLVAVHHSLKLSILKVIDMSPDGMTESAVIFLTIFFSNIFDTFQDPIQVKELFDRGIPRHGSVPMGQEETNEQNDDGEGLRENLSVFFLKTLKSSPKNRSKSRFRANFKAAVKACETDGL